MTTVNDDAVKQPDPLEVARAKDVLARAAQAEAEARKQQLTTKLAEIRAELRTARPTLGVLAAQIRGLRADEQNLARAIATRQERLTELHAAKPSCADFLPNDPDVLVWQARVNSCESEIAQFQSVSATLPSLYRLQLETVELQQRVTSLEYAETNCVNALRGLPRSTTWGGKEIVGGVSGVF